MNLKEKILAANDLPTVKVVVPEWDTTVNVATLTAKNRDAWAMNMQGKADNLSLARTLLVCACIVNDDGTRVFADEDAEALASKSTRAIERVFAVAQKLNGFTKDEQNDLVKN